LANVEDLPEDLRPLARRVPTESRLNQSLPELKARCEEASALLAEADMASDEDQARRKRREADRMLSAMSLETFVLEQQRLLSAIGEAQKIEGGYEAAHLTDELNQLIRDNPQPLERISGSAA
jgi:hypothetical protein